MQYLNFHGWIIVFVALWLKLWHEILTHFEDPNSEFPEIQLKGATCHLSIWQWLCMPILYFNVLSHIINWGFTKSGVIYESIFSAMHDWVETLGLITKHYLPNIVMVCSPCQPNRWRNWNTHSIALKLNPKRHDFDDACSKIFLTSSGETCSKYECGMEGAGKEKVVIRENLRCCHWWKGQTYCLLTSQRYRMVARFQEDYGGQSVMLATAS